MYARLVLFELFLVAAPTANYRSLQIQAIFLSVCCHYIVFTMAIATNGRIGFASRQSLSMAAAQVLLILLDVAFPTLSVCAGQVGYIPWRGVDDFVTEVRVCLQIGMAGCTLQGCAVD